MKLSLFTLSSLLLVFISGCYTPKETGSFTLESGRYKNIAESRTPVFVKFEDSLIRMFALSEKQNETIFLFPEIQSPSPTSPLKLLKPSFDLDIITIPFKYRFPTQAFPDQFNTNFSGAFYAGFRNDVYSFKYKENPLGEHHRMIAHYGYGAGVFTGLGSTAMNPWVTLGRINIEYDGFVIITGAESVIAVNNFTFGIGVGIDHLMDKNRKLWIYRGKPWIGLTIGLNLN